MDGKRIVVALGGNALQVLSGSPTAQEQQEMVDKTAEKLVEIIGQGNDLVVVHGKNLFIAQAFMAWVLFAFAASSNKDIWIAV